MTGKKSNPDKKAARSYAAHHGVAYSRALRIVRVQRAARMADEFLNPLGEDLARSTADDVVRQQAEFGRRATSAERQTASARSSWREQLEQVVLRNVRAMGGLPIEEVSLTLPHRSPRLIDAVIARAELRRTDAAITITRRDGCDELSLRIAALVWVGGELPIDQAEAAEARGKVIQHSSNHCDGYVTVALMEAIPFEATARLYLANLRPDLELDLSLSW